MSTTTVFQRQALRAATAIHEQLVGATSIAPLPAVDADAWQELQRLASRFEQARQRGWRAAAESLLIDLTYSASRVGREIESLKKDVESIGQPDTARFHEPKARLGQSRILRKHSAVPIETVEPSREVAHPGGHTLRRALGGGVAYYARVFV